MYTGKYIADILKENEASPYQFISWTFLMEEKAIIVILSFRPDLHKEVLSLDCNAQALNSSSVLRVTTNESGMLSTSGGYLAL